VTTPITAISAFGENAMFQNLFAVAVLFQQRKPAADAVVQADRFPEGRQVDAFNQHHHGDEDQDVDDGCCTQLHDDPQTIGS
jgi:hypothetical protein